MWIKIIAAVVFSACFSGGIYLASKKPFWNDERYSFTASTVGASYQDIVLGHLGEGNNSPLFYVLQKAQCDIFSFHAPESWLNNEWLPDQYAQAFLRIQPALYVALALAVLFYYFAIRESILLGIYAVAVALSSFMFWSYFTQARPYALLFSLTLIQMLIVMEMFRFPERLASLRTKLMGVHVLLALLSTVSLIQIVVVSTVMWLFVDRKWKSYVLLTLLPVGIVIYYYVMAIKLSFYFADGPLALISANIPKDRLFILMVFGGYVAWDFWKNKRLTEAGKFCVVSFLMLLAFFALAFKLKVTEMLVGKGVFQVSNRYFMALTPVGIVAVTLFSQELIKVCKHRFGQIVIICILGYLLYFRIKRTMAFGY